MIVQTREDCGSGSQARPWEDRDDQKARYKVGRQDMYNTTINIVPGFLMPDNWIIQSSIIVLYLPINNEQIENIFFYLKNGRFFFGKPCTKVKTRWYKVRFSETSLFYSYVFFRPIYYLYSHYLFQGGFWQLMCRGENRKEYTKYF